MERIIDYRPETPTVCECGARVHVTGEQRGQVYLSGPADLQFAAAYGITTEGPVETIWHTYECERGHEGPVLFAGAGEPPKNYEVQCVRAARRGARGRWRIIENSTRRDIVVSSHDVRAAAIRERDRLRAEARA